MTFTTHTNSPTILLDFNIIYEKGDANLRRFQIIKNLGFCSNSILFLGSETNVSNNVKIGAKLHDLPTNTPTPITFYFEVDNKVFGLSGTSNGALNGLMKHSRIKNEASTAKANTHATTLLKELITKIKIKNQTFDKETILLKINETHGDLVQLFEEVYYDSAIKQMVAFNKIGVNIEDYISEIQNEGINKLIYDKVAILTSIHKDNWNPADVWFIKKNSIEELKVAISIVTTIEELNELLIKHVMNKDILPISLKQVIGEAQISLHNIGEKRESNYDFDILGLNIPKSFKSLFVTTPSDYQFKLNMRGSADSINLNKEGSFSNKNASEGAFVSNLWNYYVINNPTDYLTNGAKTPYLTKEIFTKKREIFVKYKNIISNDIQMVEFKDLDLITGRRYQIISDHVEYIMAHPDLVEYSYFASKKLYDGAGAFYLISE